MKPEFILVTGANATSKTTLIKDNLTTLEAERFKIIIPDDILQYATSHTDAPMLIQEHIDEALSGKNNFILETSFQFDTLIKTLDKIEKAGYHMSLYQLFVRDIQESFARVKDRFKGGGYYIPTEQVRSNYQANLKNVAEQYSRFDRAVFIDNADSKSRMLAAEFRKKELILFRPVDHAYLKKLFKYSAAKGKITAKANKIVQANKICPSLLPKKRHSNRRLKL